MANPLTTHLSIEVCADAADAIARGYDWRSANPPVWPIEVKQLVVVRNGTEQGTATVDFVLEDPNGQRSVVMVTGNLLKSIPC